MDLVGTVKLQSKLKKNSEGICQLQLMYICGFSKILLLFIPPELAFLRSEKESSDLYPTALFPRHHIIESTEFAGISTFYAFCVTKGAPIGKIWHRFCPCDCECCSIGCFYQCINENFLGPWAERYVTVTENVQPSF